MYPYSLAECQSKLLFYHDRINDIQAYFLNDKRLFSTIFNDNIVYNDIYGACVTATTLPTVARKLEMTIV